jgi:beta-glucosidase-like glycosyl hydrolase
VHLAGRFGFNAEVTVRDLHDTFNYVYRHLMQENPSHIRGLMASYSALDGIPVACDFDLLTKQPRYDWSVHSRNTARPLHL